MKFVVKLFPEITIKSKPVRQRFVRQLRKNVKTLMRRLDERVDVKGFWDKIEVNTPANESALDERVAEHLQRIPGIAHILRVQCYPIEDIDNAFEQMADLTIAAMKAPLEGKRFVVRAKRAGQHQFTSHDLEIYIGGALLQNTGALKVDLHHPEVTVSLEVKDNQFYIVEQRYPGLGGFPMGTQDAVLSLISGGFDSTVSSYLTMKRGLRTHFCFFNLGGIAHEVGVKQVSLYLWERYGASHRVKFVSVPFEAVVAEILRSIHHSQMGVILKRMMLRAASKIAEEMEIQALVTGESIAQVSSQTLTNLSIIDEVTNTLVIRPLVTADKTDIIRTSAQIGTEEFAKNMPEYCGVISDRPTTRASRSRIEEEESGFDFDVLESAIAQTQTVNIDSILQSDLNVAEVELVRVPLVDDVVVDIRHPDEVQKAPLELTNNTVLHVPFYELNAHLEQLSPDNRFLLYCDKGTMSQLHASHIKAQGRSNVLVYQPENGGAG